MTEVVILQRFIPAYRVAVFEEIAEKALFNITYVIGDNIDGIKARNSENLSNLNFIKLKSKGLKVFNRTLVWHIGLLKTLIRLKPKVIVCEAESHLLGYLIAITYKILLLGRPKLIKWCFFILPGRENERGHIELTLRKIIRSFFSAFISYSEMGKNYLIKQGIESSRIYVAHNVCDTKRFLDEADHLKLSNQEAKKHLKLNDKFVVSFIGSLEELKCPDMIIDIACNLHKENIHFLIIGEGPLRKQLHQIANEKNLSNLSITGRISEDISIYYRATDLTILPGRGGIVISESMCFSTPVITHQADGTELDLIINHNTGVILHSNEIDLFSRSIKILSSNLENCKKMGLNAKNLIISKMNTANMASAVLKAIDSLI